MSRGNFVSATVTSFDARRGSIPATKVRHRAARSNLIALGMDTKSSKTDISSNSSTILQTQKRPKLASGTLSRKHQAEALHDVAVNHVAACTVCIDVGSTVFWPVQAESINLFSDNDKGCSPHISSKNQHQSNGEDMHGKVTAFQGMECTYPFSRV
ncbi:TPA: hypothetical protein ACH3X1_004827 [Trebouxia sp. C0004]